MQASTIIHIFMANHPSVPSESCYFTDFFLAAALDF